MIFISNRQHLSREARNSPFSFQKPFAVGLACGRHSLQFPPSWGMSSGANPSIAASILDQNDEPRFHTPWQLATESPCLSYRASGDRFLGFFVCVCHRSWHQTSIHLGTAKLYSTYHHKRNFGEEGLNVPPTTTFLYLRILFWLPRWKGANKKIVARGVRGVRILRAGWNHFSPSFKPDYFKTFLPPMVDCPRPMPLAKLCQSLSLHCPYRQREA